MLDDGNRLIAGSARRDITPEEGLLPLPFFGPICMEFIADRIHVRALYLENKEDKTLFITFDMGEVPFVQETLDFLQQQTGMKKESIFLSATHTHGVPFIGYELIPSTEEAKVVYRKWYENIKRELIEAVQEAINQKCPASIGYAEGKSYINVNRDEIIDGKAAVGNNYERPSDKTLSLVRVEDENKNLIALLVNYAVHAVVTNGCMIGNGLGLGGDLPGRTSTTLEDQLEGVVMWTSGAAGDQNPRVMTNFGFDETSDVPKTKSLGEAGYMILDQLVSEHVRNILSVNQKLVCDKKEARIISLEKKVFVRSKDTETSVPFTLKLLCLGNIALMGISAEVPTTVGAKVQEVSDAEHTILVTHAQGCMGYTPDDWEYDHHTFEVDNALVSKGCAQPAFVQGFKEMFEEKCN